jgi:hypothetical protein
MLRQNRFTNASNQPFYFPYGGMQQSAPDGGLRD